jgi:hypothetical protein
MKRIVSILLCVCLLLQAFTCVSVLTAYRLHPEFITKYFCVNQDRPQLNCKGKCFVKKEVKKSQESSQRNAGPEDVVHLFFAPALMVTLCLAVSTATAPVPSYPQRTYPEPLFATFHPPRG